MAIPEPLKNWLRPFFGRRRVADTTKIAPGPELRAALDLADIGMSAAKPDPALTALVDRTLSRSSTPSARELFSLENRLLPCWLESDLISDDGWLTSDRTYPCYYRLFQEMAALHRRPRLLEIGVRTGYIGVTFARAVAGPCHYFGVDPNQYCADGLDRANASFELVRASQPGFKFNCLLGYSDNPGIQRKVCQQGPFDIIHIDGDHTVYGKLVDLELARSALAPGGFVLVDDFDFIPHVVQESMGRSLQLGWYSRFAALPTHRGLGILQV